MTVILTSHRKAHSPHAFTAASGNARRVVFKILLVVLYGAEDGLSEFGLLTRVENVCFLQPFDFSHRAEDGI